MAAGQGFKTFATGDILTAADTNGYLMQGVWVFASATARDAAVTSPQEGNTCYLKDTDQILVYSGSAWVVKSGAASPLTTKGDLYTYSTTDARLGVGTNGQVLTADSTAGTGLKWATAASGSTFSGCRLTRSASASIANATETTLNWDTETFDTDAYHSTSTNTNRITIPSGKAGYYELSMIINWTDANASGRRLAVFRVNGTAAQSVEYTPSSSATLQYYGANVAYFSAADYIDVYVLNTSGSTLNIGTGSYFGITYLGA